jgi:3-isopropylmalate dehydratase small subunit
MTPFTRLLGAAYALADADIDTDTIFPARFLVLTSKAGLGRYAFRDYQPLRGQEAEESAGPAALRGAKILIGGPNFGCGSSREQAVWALQDLGLRCLIAPSFGEIFSANCFKNGLLPVVLPRDVIDELIDDAGEGAPISVDLTTLLIKRASGQEIPFQVEPWRREALLTGADEIDLVLAKDGAAISAFEARRSSLSPWMKAGG